MLELAEKLNPAWREGDGLCKSCFDSLVKASGEAETEASQVTNVAQRYRYVLSREESATWANNDAEAPDPCRDEIVKRVSAEAMIYGYETWTIFGCDEELLVKSDEDPEASSSD